MKKENVKAIAIILALLGITIFALSREKSNIREQGPSKIFVGHSERVSDKAYEELLNGVIEIEKSTNNDKVKKELSDLIAMQEEKEVIIENFNRTSAVKSLQTLLINIGIDPNDENKSPQESIKERLEALDKEETDMKDVLSEKAINKLYMSEEFEKDKFNRRFAASSLLVYYDIIVGNGNEDVTPLIENYDDLIYLDTRFMTAHIPLDLLIGGNTGISFEMQYVDGEWKLNPYTSMQSLNLMSILNNEE